MIGGKQPRGFTIFETMIFLAISGVLLATAIHLISGKQGQTEFDQGIRLIQSNILTEISHVSEGYYVSNGDFTCTAQGSGYGKITITWADPSSSTQGTNYGCQYIGAAIQFAPSGRSNEYDIYPVAGSQYSDAAGDPVTSFTDAYPHAITEALQTVTLPEGITVGAINNSKTGDPALLGFFTLGSTSNISAGGSDSNGGGSIDLVPYSNDTLKVPGNPVSNIANASYDNTGSNAFNPSGGEAICFNSGSTNQSGLITIGINGNPTSVNLKIQGHLCP